MGRIREWFKHNSNIHVDVVGPQRSAIHTQPEDINPDIWDNNPRIRWCEIKQPANAYRARFFPDADALQDLLDSNAYDIIYSREPTMMRNLLACYYGRARPRTVVHTSFQDVPSAPKFGATLWHGQIESVLRDDIDVCFFQCQPALDKFIHEMADYGVSSNLIERAKAKFFVDDDGYSRYDINKPVDEDKMGFSFPKFYDLTQGKQIIFFPNRISPASGDYTNSKLFLDMLPKLRDHRQDFCAIVNPGKHPGTKKEELDASHGHCGLVTVSPEVLNRDEYRFVARLSDLVVCLYLTDLYGATAQRECIELGACPIWVSSPELSDIARVAGVDQQVLVKPDFSDLVDVVDRALSMSRAQRLRINSRLLPVIRSRCAYEATAPKMMQRIGLL